MRTLNKGTSLAWLADTAKTLAAPALISATEWADENRVLSTIESGKHPGRFRTDFTPYMSEIQDALTMPGSPTRQVTLMCSAQIGKTTIGLNIIGYYTHIRPTPMIVFAAYGRSGKAVCEVEARRDDPGDPHTAPVVPSSAV